MKIQTFICLFFTFLDRHFPFLFRSRSEPKQFALVSPIRKTVLVLDNDNFRFEDEGEAKISAFERSMKLKFASLLRQPQANYCFAGSAFNVPFRTNGADRKHKSNRLHISRRARRKNR